MSEIIREILSKSAKAFPAVLATIILLGATSGAKAADPIEGIWLTQGGESHVKVIKCNETLCNEIIWLKNPNGSDGKPIRDNLNKNSKQRGRPIMGMPIMENMTQVGKGVWRGQLYKPRHGKLYAGHVRQIASDRLELKGCHEVFPICKTQIWKKVRDLQQNELQAANQ